MLLEDKPQAPLCSVVLAGLFTKSVPCNEYWGKMHRCGAPWGMVLRRQRSTRAAAWPPCMSMETELLLQLTSFSAFASQIGGLAAASMSWVPRSLSVLMPIGCTCLCYDLWDRVPDMDHHAVRDRADCDCHRSIAIFMAFENAKKAC